MFLLSAELTLLKASSDLFSWHQLVFADSLSLLIGLTWINTALGFCRAANVSSASLLSMASLILITAACTVRWQFKKAKWLVSCNLPILWGEAEQGRIATYFLPMLNESWSLQQKHNVKAIMYKSCTYTSKNILCVTSSWCYLQQLWSTFTFL